MASDTPSVTAATEQDYMAEKERCRDAQDVYWRRRHITMATNAKARSGNRRRNKQARKSQARNRK